MNWDLSRFFPEFEGPEMIQFKQTLEKDIASLYEKAHSLSALSPENVEQWEEIFLKHEDIMVRLEHLGAYISCLSAVDARNESYRKHEAEMSRLYAEFSKIEIELLRAIKDVPEDVFKSFIDRKAFDNARYYLRRLHKRSRWTMSVEKELLAADLSVDGLSAWGRLYNTIAGKLEFDMEYPDGRRERIPISQRASLMEDPDRGVRRAAFEGGNRAWQSVEDVAAAALNAISGTRLTLNRHRGIDHFLDVALFQSAITRKTLEAMFEAIYANLEIPRRILRLKAKALGLDAVAWYDLSAPLPIKEQERIPWDKGTSLVKDSFRRAFPELAEFFQMALEKNWFEWEPRPGKQPGGFCTGSMLIKESRIFMTFNGSMGDVRTLAHESGHAFHSHIMRDLRPYAQHYPMTLAESASTFAELILTDGLLADDSLSDTQKALLLDQELSHAAIYLLDIPVRYEFEKSLYEERAKGELSVSRLKELMTETQRRIFGNVLEQGGEDPYFWASKLHFYITEVTFYNFPYTFGYLLSRGLYAMFKREESAFLPRYEEFLRLTGSDTCENVVRRSLGRDIESPEFWHESILSLEEPLSQLDALLPKVLP